MTGPTATAETVDIVEEGVASLRERGYLILRSVYDADEVRKARDLVAEWHARISGTTTEEVPRFAADTPMIWNLQAKDPYFLELLFAPAPLEQILMRMLNDPWYKAIPQDAPNYILRNYVARSSAGFLPLHIDSFIPYIGPHVISMQCAIILEDTTRENGCTLVVPGSHNWGEFASQERLEDAIPLEARAGDIALWDSRLWHAAGANESGRTRWVMTASFTGWWVKQAFDIPKRLPQEIYERLTDRQKAVLGFCSIPYGDETEGIDLRRGYDSLADDVSAYRRPRES